MGSCFGKRKQSKASVDNKDNIDIRSQHNTVVEDEKQSLSDSNGYEEPVKFLPATLDYEVPTRPSFKFEDL